MQKIQLDKLNQMLAFWGPDGGAMQSLLDLTVIEDNHPTHTENERRRSSRETLANKALDLEASLKRFQTALSIAATGRTVRERKAAANRASDELSGLVLFLAAYSFDSARRFAIMHQALQPLRDSTKSPNPRLVRAIRDDDVAINEPLGDVKIVRGQPKNFPLKFSAEWRVRARRSWLRLDAWHAKAQPDEPCG